MVQEKALVKWKGEQITISFHDVKTLICPYATDQETAVFLKTCQSLQLNPFANEIYLIKYSEGDKAAIVIAIDSYLKAAEGNESFNGFEAGTVLRDSGGKLDFREGALVLPDEEGSLVGGWARIYRKDREKPFYIAVNKAECVRYTRDGRLTKFWTEEKQPSMLRKTALKRALIEAFPSLFAGTMATAEVGDEGEFTEVGDEGEFPPAYERGGEAYWPKWWARQKEKGLGEKEVHSILGVASIKDDWLAKGRTLEEAEDIINAASGKDFKQIDPTWLDEALKEIKWSEGTAKSWIAFNLGVAAEGKLNEVLSQLTREQSEKFVQEIQSRLEKQPSKLI